MAGLILLQIKLHLDRAVATPSWSDIFGHSKVTHLPPSDSDHIPILLQASTVLIPHSPKHHRFKFESFWLQCTECDHLVLAQWATEFERLPMFCLTRKITKTRLALDKWQKENFRARQQLMLTVRLRLEAIMEVPISPSLQVENKELMTQFQSLLSQEEAFWTQRSKVLWLKEGDRIPTFSTGRLPTVYGKIELMVFLISRVSGLKMMRVWNKCH